LNSLTITVLVLADGWAALGSEESFWFAPAGAEDLPEHAIIDNEAAMISVEDRMPNRRSNI